MNNNLMNNNETLVTEEEFMLPDIYNGDFSSDELDDDGAGLQLNLTRIRIPSGGQLVYELPSGNPEHPNYFPTLTGVILYNHSHLAYWEKDDDNDDDDDDANENTPPDCFSVDGVCGVGQPGGDCFNCEFNQWGSGKKGKGKACKNMRVLYLLQSGELLPIQLTLPPTSIRPFNDFYNMVFRSRRRGTCGSIVEIGLKRMNNGKDDYSVATFKKLSDFDGEKLADIKDYAKSFKIEIKQILQQRATEAPSIDDIPYAADWNGNNIEIPGDSEEFNVSSPDATINGDAEILP